MKIKFFHLPGLWFIIPFFALAQTDTPNPDEVKLTGQIWYETDRGTFQVKDCLVEVLGFNAKLTDTTDADGRFEIPMEISNEYRNYDIAIYVTFFRKLNENQYARAKRELRPRKLTSPVYDIGQVFLIPDPLEEKVPPTVWDLLEDSLLAAYAKQKVLGQDIEQLRLKLKMLQMENDDFKKQINDLKKQNAGYYDQIAELQKQNRDYGRRLDQLLAELEKKKTQKQFFNNFFINEYLDLMFVRDSVLADFESQIYQRPAIADSLLEAILDRRSLIFQRLDLFAEHSGIRAEQVQEYAALIPHRNGIFMQQNDLIRQHQLPAQMEPFTQLAEDLDTILNKQDSTVLFQLLPITDFRYHLVVPGDHLWKLAMHDPLYRNPYAWRIIYLVNKDQIADPDSIYPGQILKIPVTVSQSAIPTSSRTDPTQNE